MKASRSALICAWSIAFHAWSLCLGYNIQGAESESGAVPDSRDAVIRITSPAPASVITDYEVLVRGVLHVPPRIEIGVTVNGRTALVYGGEFATIVPPATEMTAIARDAMGTTLARCSIPVTLQAPTSEPPVNLQPAHPTGGTAPFTETFSVSTGVPVTTMSFDARGDGHADYQGTKLPKYEFTYKQPGLYFPTVTVNGTYRAVRLVRVFTKDELDVPLQKKWKAFKAALRRGDVEDAMQYVTIDKRASYRTMFNALTIPLKDINRILTDITFVKQDGFSVDYEMTGLEDGKRWSSLVRFVLDLDGIWRLRFV